MKMKLMQWALQGAVGGLVIGSMLLIALAVSRPQHAEALPGNSGDLIVTSLTVATLDGNVLATLRPEQGLSTLTLYDANGGKSLTLKANKIASPVTTTPTTPLKEDAVTPTTDTTTKPPASSEPATTGSTQIWTLGFMNDPRYPAFLVEWGAQMQAQRRKLEIAQCTALDEVLNGADMVYLTSKLHANGYSSILNHLKVGFMKYAKTHPLE